METVHFGNDYTNAQSMVDLVNDTASEKYFCEELFV